MKIQHNKPSLGEEEIKAIAEVIREGWIVHGEKVKKFENIFSKFLGLSQKSAVAVSNGTSALYLALKMLEIGLGDEVIIPTYVCTAVLNAIYMAQATPVIVDINKKDFNISYDEIIKQINKNTQAIIVPHTFGVPAEVIKIKSLGINIIEDCAQALGSKIKNQHVGTFGDLAVFSFYASKMITTAQGGMLVSRKQKFIDKANDYLNFDCRKSYYPRFNFQMTDIQAAMGIVQLNKLNNFLKKRKLIAKKYKKVCKKNEINYQKPIDTDIYEQNFYRFVIRGNKNYLNKLKNKFLQKDVKIIIPIKNWELLHNYLDKQSDRFQVAEKISKTTLSLPIFPGLFNNGNLDRVLSVIKNERGE